MFGKSKIKFSRQKQNLKKRQFAIGVDIGDFAVRIIQLKAVSKSELAVRAACEIEYPSSHSEWGDKLGFIASHLSDLHKREDFSGSHCRVSLPSCFTDVVHLQAAAEVDGSLQLPPESIPFDTDDVIVRTIGAGPRNSAAADAPVEQIVMAADRASVAGMVKLFSRTAWKCDAVSMDTSAVMECFSRVLRRDEDVDRTVLFADLGRSSVQVVISHGPELAFARNLNINTTGQWADRVGVELLNCIRYHDSIFSDRPVAEAIFVGGRANDRPACRQLAETVALPARVGDPFSGIDCSLSATPVSGPQWSVAMGLCYADATMGHKEHAA